MDRYIRFGLTKIDYKYQFLKNQLLRTFNIGIGYWAIQGVLRYVSAVPTMGLTLGRGNFKLATEVNIGIPI